MIAVGLACGEVPWERDLIAALDAQVDVQVVRRYVDVASLLADAGGGSLPDLLVLSPALRGFEEKPVRGLAAGCAALVVLLDTILPPWLDTSALDRRPVDGIHWPTFASEMAACATPDAPVLAPEPSGRVVAFAGVSGGIGTSSLCWAVASAHPSALVIDAAAQPALAFAAGLDVQADGLGVALDSVHGTELRGQCTGDRLLARPLVETVAPDAAALAMVLHTARTSESLTIVDLGRLTPACSELLPGAVDHLVLVVDAAALGLARLPAACRDLDVERVSIIVNRIRVGVAGSPRVRIAIRDLVQRACSQDPVLVLEAPAVFDRAWLHSDWSAVAQMLPPLPI